MARHLLDSIPILYADFADVTGIPLGTIKAYLGGAIDIAKMKRGNAHRFLSGLGISDEDAWTLFAIPDEARPEFRSDRPPPLGSGPAPQARLDPVDQLTLEGPLFGEMSLPAGITVFYRPGGVGRFYLMRLMSGQLLAVRDPVESPGAEVLGVLLTASFEPPPATASQPAARPRC